MNEGIMGVNPKIGVFSPQNGWVYFMEKSYENSMDLGGKNPLFLGGNTQESHIMVAYP